ncbi:MAG: DNA polymerase I, partial [Lachnospiraceae bacterium]|nr:DNA polymerase I [Lachnospiraceae bacterium]
MEKVLVIDGNSIANRAFYGIRPLSTKAGLPTNAVYGFLNILKKHIDAIEPERIVCAFDLKAPTFRHKMYGGYKATRKGMPDELAQQMPYIKRAAECLGCEVISVEGYEADDILGTVSALGEKAGGVHTYLLTGDRDSLQLVSTATTVILAKTKEDAEYTPEVFRAEYGITPAQFVDVKALMGDSSDNIPGVPGIGDKTALKLIAQAGSLDGVYAAPESLGLGKAATTKLIAGKESAYMSQELATIFREVPLGTETPGSESHRDDNALCALFDELELTSLKDRFHVREASVATQYQAPEFSPWNGEALPDGRIFIAFDGEHAAVICGEARFLLPLTGEAVGRVITGREFVCHGYKHVFGLFKDQGVHAECSFDTMLAAYLLCPGESNYSLLHLAQQYLSLDCSGLSAAEEVHLISLLTPVLEKKLDEAGMTTLLREMEISLSEVLYEMEKSGFLLDAEGLHTYIGQLQATADALAEQIWFTAGRQFNLNSPKQLGEVLFEEMGLPSPKKTKTGYATDAETL